eukprot:jgi/Astpho2/8249/Aster-01334
MSMNRPMHQQLHQLQGDCPASLGRPSCARVRQAHNAPKGRKHNVVAQAKQRASPKAASPSVEAMRKENELLRKTIESTDEAEPAAPAASQPKEGSNGKQVPAEAVPAESTLSQVNTGGVSVEMVDKAADIQETGISTPEDFWTPLAPPPKTAAYKEQYQPIKPPPEHDGTECLKWDDSLWSHADHIKYRWNTYKSLRDRIDKDEGGLEKFTQGYKYYGLNRGEHEGKTGIWYREWAPGARALALVGEFNNWDPKPEHWGVKNDFGVFQLTKIKTRLETAYGELVERIPAWIKWATQEWNEIQYNGVYYEPPKKGAPGELPTYDTSYTFRYPRPPKPRALRIYECHVGMSSAEPKINSYLDFRMDMLPRIRKLGYNCIQIMAVQEHAYYGSFGYHVTNFFAASSRFGTPDELKAMIDEAHRLGMIVLMDIVHSHASKNTNDGINMFDGTDGMYFHGGSRGYHWMWDSRCFNYGNWETLRFLLSNSRWWVDEFKFDGYRFDGVTSMMYHHHGLQMTFTGNYDEYFGLNTDIEAVVYLMLMNTMLHDIFPSVVTVGEDVSGMPTFARPTTEGGVGFDYRLQMAIADKWIEVLSKYSDHDWNMGNIVHTLTNRRYAEPCVAYAESHDQALVGDKTIAFWLMDKEMYDSMSLDKDNDIVNRGIALHKMVRLITLALGGESYLNFMGNEFGHPEWIDFPRDDTHDSSTGKFIPGNGGSLDKCRRRWDLADAEFLKYKFMQAFDRAMNHLDKAFGFVDSSHQYISRKDEGDKLVIFERGDLVFVFNFHPTNSYSDYRVGCKNPGDYKIMLSSDEPVFGGFSNVTKNSDVTFASTQFQHDGRPNSFLVYAPSRTVTVYGPAQWGDANADQHTWGIPGLGIKDRGPHFDL